MKKNDVFTFTNSDGVKVTCVVISVIREDRDDKWYLCYGQNKIFDYRIIPELEPLSAIWVTGVIIPKYDTLLSAWSN